MLHKPEFVDVSLALAAADGVYQYNNSTTHAYALQFNNAYNDVTKVEFAWSGGGNAFIVFLFGDKGNGFEQLKYTIYSYSGASQAGSVVWTGDATDYSRFAIVARPGSTSTGATDKMLHASTFKIYTDHKDWKEVRTGLEVDRNYTLCLEKNITEVKGATFWSIHNYNSSDQAVYLEEETAPLDAGKPYIYQATADKLEVVYGDQTAAAPVENGALRGTFSTMDADALAEISGNVYMMYNNALHPIGTDNHLDAHRAYLLYEALVPGEPTPSPGRQVRRMPMQDNTATALGLSNTADAPGKTLINGHLFILRGEHTYDLSGCVVK